MSGAKRPSVDVTSERAPQKQPKRGGTGDCQKRDKSRRTVEDEENRRKQQDLKHANSGDDSRGRQLRREEIRDVRAGIDTHMAGLGNARGNYIPKQAGYTLD